MVIYLGADHGGFSLKEKIKVLLKEQGYEVADMGAAALDPQDDYPDFAAAVAGKVSQDPAGSRGIMLCRSGAGMAITANKFRGVLATMGLSADQVYGSRHDDDANVLAIAADFTKEADALNMVRVFLQTPFETKEERFRRRLEKIAAVEERNLR